MLATSHHIQTRYCLPVNIHLYLHVIHICFSQTNTFQCVMVTDEANSFVIFLYADGGIQWTTGDESGGVNGFGGTPAQVGFNAGDGNRSATLPTSRTAAIVDIELTSNVGVPGMWVLQVDDNELAVEQCIVCKCYVNLIMWLQICVIQYKEMAHCLLVHASQWTLYVSMGAMVQISHNTHTESFQTHLLA